MFNEIAYIKKVFFVKKVQAGQIQNQAPTLHVAEDPDEATVFEFKSLTRDGFPQDPYTLIVDAEEDPFQNVSYFVHRTTNLRPIPKNPIDFYWDDLAPPIGLANRAWLEEVMYYDRKRPYGGFYVVETFTASKRSLGYYAVPIGSKFEQDITPLFEKKAVAKLTPYSLWKTPSETVMYLDKELAFKTHTYRTGINASIDKKVFLSRHPNPFTGWRYAVRTKVRDLTTTEVEEIYKGWILCAINLSDPSGYLSGIGGYVGPHGRMWGNFSRDVLRQTYGYAAEKLFIPVLEKGDKQLANNIHVLYDKKVTEELVSIGNTLMNTRSIIANSNAVEIANKRVTPDMIKTETLEYLKTWLSDHFKITATFTL